MVNFKDLLKEWMEDLFISRDNTFYPFELDYLSKALSKFGPKVRYILEQQLAVINRIQRIDQGKMVNLYKLQVLNLKYYKVA